MNNRMLAAEVWRRMRKELPREVTQEVMGRITMEMRNVMIERLAEGECVQLDRLGSITPRVQMKSCHNFKAGVSQVRPVLSFRFVPSEMLREEAKANLARWGQLAGKI